MSATPTPFTEVFSLDEVADDLYVVATTLPRPTLEQLTESERAVAFLAVRGLANATIAEQRGCSRSTVANQLQSAYAKLKVRSRLELANRILGG